MWKVSFILFSCFTYILGIWAMLTSKKLIRWNFHSKKSIVIPHSYVNIDLRFCFSIFMYISMSYLLLICIIIQMILNVPLIATLEIRRQTKWFYFLLFVFFFCFLRKIHENSRWDLSNLRDVYSMSYTMRSEKKIERCLWPFVFLMNLILIFGRKFIRFTLLIPWFTLIKWRKFVQIFYVSTRYRGQFW